MKEIYNKAKLINDSLTGYEFNPNTYVLVEHEDGSRFLFRSAFARKDGEWWMIFTEHHDFAVYHKEDARIMEMHIKE